MAVPVVVQAVVVYRLNTAVLDPVGSLGTDLECPETDRRLVVVQDNPAVQCTVAVVGNPAVEEDPADTHPAADRTVSFPLAPPVLHGCIALCNILPDLGTAVEVLDVVAYRGA